MGISSPRGSFGLPKSKSLDDGCGKRTKRRKKLRVLCLDGGGIRGLGIDCIVLTIKFLIIKI